MAEFTVVVHQIVRYTFPIEAADLHAAQERAESMLESGDWPDDNSMVVDDKFTIETDDWTCPGCHAQVQPSDVRRHASDCTEYDGRHGY